ncbi:MAG: hypothetical protein ACLTBX_01465 [Clostridia bacterium]
MDYKKMWEDLKGFLQKTEKMTDSVKTSGIIEIMSEFETSEYINKNGDLPF